MAGDVGLPARELPRNVLDDYEQAKSVAESYKRVPRTNLNPLRVNLIDADMLDKEMMNIFKGQFLRIFR